MAAIILMICSALCASVGQILYKFSANATQDLYTFIVNPYLYAGGAAYFIGLVFMLKALQRGELSVVYPVLATSFIWVSLLSPLFFPGDHMTPKKWLGVAVIVLGVSLIGRARAR